MIQVLITNNQTWRRNLPINFLFATPRSSAHRSELDKKYLKKKKREKWGRCRRSGARQEPSNETPPAVVCTQWNTGSSRKSPVFPFITMTFSEPSIVWSAGSCANKYLEQITCAS
ncbi:hypothetical protein NPIL_178721 [Nephila pilipes]|uniref:Uncharacterized protein n=1 Tax=Nephila pilipes TaxID=299642 RepID=A0A8X6N584_NEPPI|nr:hypothetical protein NPIL_178721 [Nephila pilipes]